MFPGMGGRHGTSPHLAIMWMTAREGGVRQEGRYANELAYER